MKPLSRVKKVGLAFLAVVVVGLAVLHVRYPLPYVYRVLAHRGPDYYDMRRFPAGPVAASDSPSALPVATDPRVAAVFEQFPDIDVITQCRDPAADSTGADGDENLAVVAEFAQRLDILGVTDAALDQADIAFGGDVLQIVDRRAIELHVLYEFDNAFIDVEEGHVTAETAGQ